MKTTGLMAAAVFAIFVAIMVARGNATTSPQNIAVATDAVGVFYTTGMTCGSCAQKIEAALKETGAVAAVKVDVDGGKIVVSFDSRKVRPQTLAERVTAVGYPTSVAAVMPGEQYRAAAGADAEKKPAQGKTGCGGGCCDKRPGPRQN